MRRISGDRLHCGPRSGPPARVPSDRDGARKPPAMSALRLGRGAFHARPSYLFGRAPCDANTRDPVPRVIAIANQKGGVGKTTTAVNLAASLAVAERRTLLIDGDPQGNATSGTGIERSTFERTTYDVLIGAASIAEARIRGVQFEHLDVVPATPDLAAADALLIPLQCEYYALEGLSQLLNTVHLIQHSVNPSLGIAGVILTMYDARLNLSRQVATDAREYFGSQVFDTVVPRNVRLAEAPSFGKPIVLYDVHSIGAQAYIAVAHELMNREAKARPEL